MPKIKGLDSSEDSHVIRKRYGAALSLVRIMPSR